MYRLLRISLSALLIANLCPCGFILSASAAADAPRVELQTQAAGACHDETTARLDNFNTSNCENCCDETGALPAPEMAEKQHGDGNEALMPYGLYGLRHPAAVNDNTRLRGDCAEQTPSTPVTVCDRLLI